MNPTEGIGRRLQALRANEASVSVCQKMITYILFVILLVIIIRREKGTQRKDGPSVTSDEDEKAALEHSIEVLKQPAMVEFKADLDEWVTERTADMRKHVFSSTIPEIVNDKLSGNGGGFINGSAIAIHLSSLVRSHYGDSSEAVSEEAPRSFLRETLSSVTQQSQSNKPSSSQPNDLPRIVASSSSNENGFVSDTALAFGFDALPSGMTGMWRRVRPLYRSGHIRNDGMGNADSESGRMGILEYLDHLLALINGASLQTTVGKTGALGLFLNKSIAIGRNDLIHLMLQEAFGENIEELLLKGSYPSPSSQSSLVEGIVNGAIGKNTEAPSGVTKPSSSTGGPTSPTLDASGVFSVDLAKAQLPELKDSVYDILSKQLNETLKYAAYNELEQSVLWRLLSLVAATEASDQEDNQHGKQSAAEKFVTALLGRRTIATTISDPISLSETESKSGSAHDEAGTIISVMTHTISDPRVTLPWWLPFGTHDDIMGTPQNDDESADSAPASPTRRRQAASEAKTTRDMLKVPPLFGRRHSLSSPNHMSQPESIHNEETSNRPGLSVHGKGEALRHVEMYSANRDGLTLQSPLSILRWVGFQQYTRLAAKSIDKLLPNDEAKHLRPMWILVGVPTGRGMRELIKKAYEHHETTFGTVLRDLPIAAQSPSTTRTVPSVGLLVKDTKISISQIKMGIPNVALLALQEKLGGSSTELLHTLHKSFEFPSSSRSSVFRRSNRSLTGDGVTSDVAADEALYYENEEEQQSVLGVFDSSPQAEQYNHSSSQRGAATSAANKAFSRFLNFKSSLDEHIAIFTKLLVYSHSLTIGRRTDSAIEKHRQAYHVIPTAEMRGLLVNQDLSTKGNVSDALLEATVLASPTFFYAPKEYISNGDGPPTSNPSDSTKDHFGSTFDSQCIWLGSLTKMQQGKVSTPVTATCGIDGGNSANSSSSLLACEINSAVAMMASFWRNPPFYLTQDSHYQGLFISSCGHTIEMVLSSEGFDRFVKVTVMPYMLWYLTFTVLLAFGIGSIKVWIHNSRARLLRVSPYQILMFISLQFLLNFTSEVLMQIVPATTRVSRIGWMLSLLNIGVAMTLFNEITAARLEQEGQTITDPDERTRTLRLGRLRSFVFLIVAISIPNSLPLILKQDVASALVLFFVPALFWLPQLRLAISRDGGKGLSISFIVGCTFVVLVPLNLFITNVERLQLSVATYEGPNKSSLRMVSASQGGIPLSEGDASKIYHTVIAPRVPFNVDDFDTFTTSFALPSTSAAYVASVWGSRILIFCAVTLLVLRVINHSQLRRRLLPKWARGNAHEYQVEIIRDMKALSSLVAEDTDCIICTGSLLEDPPNGLNDSSSSSDEEGSAQQRSPLTPSGRSRVHNHLHPPRSQPPSPTERQRIQHSAHEGNRVNIVTNDNDTVDLNAIDRPVAIEVTTPSSDEGEHREGEGVRQRRPMPPPTLMERSPHQHRHTVNIQQADALPSTFKPSRPPPSLWVTPCKHYFHESCLSQWMEEKMVCPLCRAPLPEP